MVIGLELKKCPFCGGFSALLEDMGFFIHCRYCYARTRDCNTWEEAVKEWNARDYEAEMQELLRIKREYEYAKVKVNEFLNRLREFEKNTHSHVVIMDVDPLRKELEELLK